MNESFNEEMAWRNLQDMQREMENRRLVDGGGPALRWWLPARLIATFGAKQALPFGSRRAFGAKRVE